MKKVGLYHIIIVSFLLGSIVSCLFAFQVIKNEIIEKIVNILQIVLSIAFVVVNINKIKKQ